MMMKPEARRRLNAETSSRVSRIREDRIRQCLETLRTALRGRDPEEINRLEQLLLERMTRRPA